ncbi:hypothetical protein BCR33DRAFT_727031 [Rhizoclosmatium globosum]|uniref:Uncharacterized protein n=1 Tax=Rhizoclosmatium globosum TaxID=329046 RepID=A0A1Y2ASB1_9FUNG|nr:hypothetical protein BCR33DRAFT_727031 [Rhizoclosmatium globosum]|eukprot:ORY25386.1 hypothetical protein BCR33DRAFT_727031 [Rhizoclosmatium globosum]
MHLVPILLITSVIQVLAAPANARDDATETVTLNTANTAIPAATATLALDPQNTATSQQQPQLFSANVAASPSPAPSPVVALAGQADTDTSSSTSTYSVDPLTAVSAGVVIAQGLLGIVVTVGSAVSAASSSAAPATGSAKAAGSQFSGAMGGVGGGWEVVVGVVALVLVL